MKKIIVLAMVIGLAISVCPVGQVQAKDLVAESTEETLVKEYSYDEAVDRLIEKLEISEREAIKILGPKTPDMLTTIPSEMEREGIAAGTRLSGTYFQEFNFIDNFGMNMSVEYGNLAEMYYYNQFRQINEILSKWELPGSSGLYTINNAYHTDDCTNPDYAFTDQGRSQVEIEIQFSGQAAMEAGIDIYVTTGYSFSITGTFTVYFRKTKTGSHYFSIY